MFAWFGVAVAEALWLAAGVTRKLAGIVSTGTVAEERCGGDGSVGIGQAAFALASGNRASAGSATGASEAAPR